MLTNKLGTSYVEYKYAGYSSSSVAQGVTAQVLECQSGAGASAYAGYSQKAEDYLSDVQAYVKTVASATSDVPTIPTVTVPTIVSVADPAPVTTTSGTRPVLPVTVGGGDQVGRHQEPGPCRLEFCTQQFVFHVRGEFVQGDR
ncbi:hypothetical protein BPORC_1115 [Bifidobacterium porcinum]|nr:hypothetical protein BPORC_1115 [Bifidobacterium porcinum]